MFFNFNLDSDTHLNRVANITGGHCSASKLSFLVKYSKPSLSLYQYHLVTMMQRLSSYGLAPLRLLHKVLDLDLGRSFKFKIQLEIQKLERHDSYKKKSLS